MRKYLYIFKSEVMTNMQYIFNLLVGFISYFILIFIFLNLWKYIYSDPNELINGYNMNQMIWYVIITEILWMSLGGRKLCRKICEDVRGGNIAYNINKPYSYIGYILSSHLGSVVVKGSIFTILGMLLGLIFLGKFPHLTLLSIIIVLITSLLATIINTLFVIFIGLFSFIIEDANPFWWLYSKVILVFGTLFPIEYFPGIIKTILSYSPIYAVSYGPAKLFVDFSIPNMVNVIIVQIIYLIIIYVLCLLIYRKGVRKLNVNGG